MRRFEMVGGGGVERSARLHVEVPDDPEDTDDTESEVPVCVPSSLVHGRLPSDEAFDLVSLLETLINSFSTKVRIDWCRCSVVSVRCVVDIF
jgi:hypothetical protein